MSSEAWDNGVTDTEGVHLGRQLERSLGEVNMLLLASLGIHFSSFHSRWGLWVWETPGFRHLLESRMPQHTASIVSLPSPVSCIPLPDFQGQASRFSETTLQILRDKPPDSQRPSGETVTKTNQPNKPTTNQNNHGRETAKKYPPNSLFKGEEGFFWASKMSLLQGCGCYTLAGFTHRCDIPRTGTTPK